MATKPKPTWDLIMHCGHALHLEKRPNPRKAWPDSQMCETCKKKQRVVEIRSPIVYTAKLTAPDAPKKYLKKLQRKLKAGG